MPFTFSHPAIVLPLVRKKNHLFSATALIIGSMTPDFESILLVRQFKVHSHKWLGMLWYDMPLGLFLCLGFHFILKKPLLHHLPNSLGSRLHYAANFNFFDLLKRKPLIVLSSLFIGIFSHLLWDGLTHLNIQYPDARTSTIEFMGHRLYILLQYMSSFLGALYIMYKVLLLPKATDYYEAPQKLIFWIYTLLIAIFVASILVTNIFDDISIYNLVVVYIILFSFLVGLTISSILYLLRLR
jgi:hypothetical protein